MSKRRQKVAEQAQQDPQVTEGLDTEETSVGSVGDQAVETETTVSREEGTESKQSQDSEELASAASPDKQSIPNAEASGTESAPAGPPVSADPPVSEGETIHEPFIPPVTVQPNVEVQDLSHVHEGPVLSQAIDFNAIRTQISDAGAVVLQSIQEYMVNMDPKKPQDSEQVVAQHQVAFASALSILINRLDDRDFAVLWRMLLALFHEYEKGVFQEEMVNRAPDWVQLNHAEHAAFYRTLNLLAVTREAKTRNALAKTINWDYTCEFGFTDEARNRLMGFYQL